MRSVRLALLVCLGFLTGAGAASLKTTKKTKPESSDKVSKAAQERMTRATTPSASHKLLDPLVGNWEESIRCWTSPKDKPEATKGRSEITWVLGGRFLQQNFSGVVRGQNQQGLGYIGFDTLTNRFDSNWYDTTSTAVRTTFGAYDSQNKLLNAAGTIDNPATGQPQSIRTVLRFLDADTHIYEMYTMQPNGLELKQLEIVSKRTKM